MIREHPWNFAIKEVTLTGSPITNPQDFTYEYDKPTDYLKIFKLVPDTVEYQIIGDKIVADTSRSEGNFTLSTGGSTTNMNIISHGAAASWTMEIVEATVASLNGLSRTITAVVDSNNFTVAALPFALQEGDKVKLISTSTIKIKYMADVDEDLFDASFEEALAFRLAAAICFALIQDNNTKQMIIAESKEADREARSMDAQEGTPPDLIDNRFKTVRY